MKTILSLAFVTTFIAGAVLAQPVMRPKPGGVVTPNAIPGLDKQMLDRDALAKRLRPAPKYLAPVEFKNILPQTIALAQTGAFTLNPAMPEVDGRGKLTINGDVSVPNPLPTGFPGQAVLRYRMIGMGAGYAELGHATLTINAVKGKFYAVDCLAMVNSGRVNFKIYGTDANAEGVTDPKSGHLTFIVRRTSDNGPITIYFHPDKLIQETPNPLQLNTVSEKNVMDFWGCQITPAA